jgi:PAS domain S-box-containing protein
MKCEPDSDFRGTSEAQPDEPTGMNIPFAALLDAAPDAMVVVDRDGRIQLVNRQTVRMFGYRSDEITGETVERLLPDSLHAIHRQHRQGYVSAPRTRAMGTGLELRALRKNGSSFPVEISLSPLDTPDGLVVTAIIRDITRRKRNEEEKQRLLERAEAARIEAERAAARLSRVQAISDRALAHLHLNRLLDELLERVHALLEVDEAVILLLDPERQVLIPRAAIGIPQLVGSGIEIPIGRGFAGKVAADRRSVTVVDIETIDVVNPLLRQAGIQSLLGVPLLVEGRLVGVVHVGTTYTREFGSDEIELLQLVADRLALAVDNALLYQAAQQAIQARETFLSVASHELKTPLTTVKGWVHMIVGELKRAEEMNPASIAMFAVELAEQVDRLDVLITDLLDASRIQQGQMDLRPGIVDLALLAQRVVGRFGYTPEYAQSHRLIYEGPRSAVGRWDADRLDQVLTNLVSNALKYSPSGGEVRLRLSLQQDFVELSVIDQGIGISVADQAELFRPFSRTDEARRHASGTGLGLFITKQIVELHGGTIDLISDVGAGTTISVRLPVKPN